MEKLKIMLKWRKENSRQRAKQKETKGNKDMIRFKRGLHMERETKSKDEVSELKGEGSEGRLKRKTGKWGKRLKGAETRRGGNSIYRERDKIGVRERDPKLLSV